MLAPLALDEHHRCKEGQFKGTEIGVVLTDLSLYLSPPAVMPCSGAAVLHLLLLEEADFIQIERSGVLVSKVSKLPVVNDLYFGLVRATGDAFDETRTV